MKRALASAVIFLAIIGFIAAAGRVIFVDDLAGRAEPVRQRILLASGSRDLFPEARKQEIRDFDTPYRLHRLAALLHVVPGCLFMALAPLQLSTRIRRRHLRLHRWIGRLLVVSSLVGVGSAFFFGFLMPFGGRQETIPIALFGGLFGFSILRGFVAIRRHDVATHREWMIRAFATGLGVSTVRLVSAPIDLFLSPRGYDGRELFVLAIWIGFGTTVAVAEMWIRATRPVSAFLTEKVISNS